MRKQTKIISLLLSLVILLGLSTALSLNASAGADDHVHTPGNPVRESEIPPTEHALGFYEMVVYCTDCGEELSREIKTIDYATFYHLVDPVSCNGELEYVPEVPPTATEDGVLEHYRCNKCGSVFDDDLGIYAEDDLSVQLLPRKPILSTKLGDIDGDGAVTIMDATILSAYLSRRRGLNGGPYQPADESSLEYINADMDLDGRLSVLDQIKIQFGFVGFLDPIIPAIPSA